MPPPPPVHTASVSIAPPARAQEVEIGEQIEEAADRAADMVNGEEASTLPILSPKPAPPSKPASSPIVLGVIASFFAVASLVAMRANKN